MRTPEREPRAARARRGGTIRRHAHAGVGTAGGTRTPGWDLSGNVGLVYNDKVDLTSAQRAWASADQRNWPVPAAEDVRGKEARRLLQKLPEDKRDAALEGLRKLRDSG